MTIHPHLLHAVLFKTKIFNNYTYLWYIFIFPPCRCYNSDGGRRSSSRGQRFHHNGCHIRESAWTHAGGFIHSYTRSPTLTLAGCHVILNVCVCVYHRVEGQPYRLVKASAPRRPRWSSSTLTAASWRLLASSPPLPSHRQVCVHLTIPCITTKISTHTHTLTNVRSVTLSLLLRATNPAHAAKSTSGERLLFQV